MRQQGFSEQIDLTLVQSRMMLGFLVITHLLASLSLCLSGLNTTLVVFLNLAILCHGHQACIHYYFLATNDSVRQVWRKNGNWFVTLGDGREVAVNLVGEIIVLEWFVALRFRHDGGDVTYRLVLWRDSADADELRHLRVWLRLHVGHTVAG